MVEGGIFGRGQIHVDSLFLGSLIHANQSTLHVFAWWLKYQPIRVQQSDLNHIHCTLYVIPAWKPLRIPLAPEGFILHVACCDIISLLCSSNLSEKSKRKPLEPVAQLASTCTCTCTACGFVPSLVSAW